MHGNSGEKEGEIENNEEIKETSIEYWINRKFSNIKD